MQEFKLPDLGEGMQEAQIVEWLVGPGDTLKLDQPIVRVETDKAIVEIPSPVAGRVSEIRVPQGQVAKLGEVLVIFDNAAGANGGTTTPKTRDTATTAAATNGATSAPASSVQTTTQTQTQTRQRVLAAPAVRKLAFELGINLEQVPSSHPAGRVTIEDVRNYAEQAKAAPAIEQQKVEGGASTKVETGERESQPQVAGQDRREPLTGLRKRIAERMERSWRTIPHATAFDEVDGAALAALRQSLKPIAEQRGVRLTYMPLLIKLLIPLLKEFPIFNASLDEERREIVYKQAYHIGVAADSPEGLLVPVLRDADRLTLMEVAARLEHLIEGARKRTLSLPELSGSTFTLNNVGSFGGSSGTPIINYPEAAILAIGRLQEKPIVRNGAILARPMMPLALSFDHRLIDGAQAGRFLARFKALVENPQQLMLDMI